MTIVTISMPDELLAQIDKTAKNEKRTRSGLLQEAYRFYISSKQIDANPSIGKTEVIQALIQSLKEVGND